MFFGSLTMTPRTAEMTSPNEQFGPVARVITTNGNDILGARLRHALRRKYIQSPLCRRALPYKENDRFRRLFSADRTRLLPVKYTVRTYPARPKNEWPFEVTSCYAWTTAVRYVHYTDRSVRFSPSVE